MAAVDLDITKRSRRGPEPLGADEKRDHCVSVRLNADELSRLDVARAPAKMLRGEYLRAAALHKLPPTIPTLNRTAYVELARVGANINQIAKRLNSDELAAVDLPLVRAELHALRLALLAADPSAEDE